VPRVIKNRLLEHETDRFVDTHTQVCTLYLRMKIFHIS